MLICKTLESLSHFQGCGKSLVWELQIATLIVGISSIAYIPVTILVLIIYAYYPLCAMRSVNRMRLRNYAKVFPFSYDIHKGKEEDEAQKSTSQETPSEKIHRRHHHHNKRRSTNPENPIIEAVPESQQHNDDQNYNKIVSNA